MDITDEDLRAAVAAVRAGEPTLGHVLDLVFASLEREVPLVPAPLVDAVHAKFTVERDHANGGADQFVWNQGIDAAREVASAFRAVGAVQNADLLDRLADALVAYHAEHPAEKIAEDVVTHFLAYRKRVAGPFFQVPEPDEELAEVLPAYAAAHAAEVKDV
jgi:hypothetical protein